MNTMNSPAPKLLKARIRHSRWFSLLLIPLLIFSIGVIEQEEFVEITMDWLGFALIILCVLGRSYCTLFIGGVKNEMVVRDGPFSIVRNPLYVFSFFGIVGIGMQSSRLSILFLLVAAFIIYYYFVVRREEAYLLNKFGDAYTKYLNEVPRWFPKFSLWSEPKEIVTRPYMIRQTMFDALVFLLPWPFFELLEALHRYDIIPSIITL